MIAIANHKGGVGKTTSVQCLGDALAKMGKEVLLIDLDAQQNLSFSITQNEDPELSVYDTLVHDTPLPIVNVRPRLDLAPSSLDLARAEIDLSTKMARECILREALTEDILQDYDYVLIDCPPSLGIVTTNAFVAADEVLIPLTAEVLPFKGLRMLDEVLSEVKRRVNPKVNITGIFFTRFFNRKINREMEDLIKAKYTTRVMAARIRENISLAELPLSGKSIFDYDAKCNGAADYMALARELDDRIAD